LPKLFHSFVARIIGSGSRQFEIHERLDSETT